MDTKRLRNSLAPTTVTAITCPACKTTIYSRANHDYHGCDCKGEKGITIDGGPNEYIRFGWHDNISRPEPFQLTLNVSVQELYNDWNYRTNKYGWIREGKNVSEGSKRKFERKPRKRKTVGHSSQNGKGKT